ncbi:MAG: segregation/condensation protein A [Thermomicrobiales bacterium]
MVTQAEPNHVDTGGLTLANYQLRLPDFEGPLDLLLRLIERSQMAIADVSLVAVTDQFLEQVNAMQEAGTTPDETIAEFAAVGTRLTLLKSRSLLPRPPRAEDEELTQSDLAAELAQYKVMKAAALQLGEIHAAGHTIFPPSPRIPVSIPATPVQEMRLVPYEASVLLRSIRRRLTVTAKPIELIRQRKVVSIREMIDRVIDLTARLSHRPISFWSMTESYRQRSEVATAFLAVLVLVRRNALEAEQDALFGDIRFQRATATDTPDDGAVSSEDLANEFLN